MPKKDFELPEIGIVSFYKRRSAKSIRIRITGSKVSVSLPYWAPYKAAIEYVKSKKNWIVQNAKPELTFRDGDHLGNRYQLNLISTDKTRFSFKRKDNVLIIGIPSSQNVKSAQSKINSYIIEQLRVDAEDKIIPMARQLAIAGNFEVSKIEIKNLKSRWGSCNSKNELVFNLYLMQLPDEQINYVIYHELAHTIQMNHSKAFWDEVEKHVPNYKQLRREIKVHAPDILVYRP